LREIYFATDNGLYSLLFAFSKKAYRAVHNAVVGNGNTCLPEFFCGRYKLTYSARSVKQAVFFMNVKMRKRHFYTSFAFIFLIH
jgi:hypothetical protein